MPVVRRSRAYSLTRSVSDDRARSSSLLAFRALMTSLGYAEPHRRSLHVGVTRAAVLLREWLQPVTTVLSIDDVPIKGTLRKRQVRKLLDQERHICFSLLPQYWVTIRKA